MARRIGIFPGTFDPVHKGHIAFSLEAMRVCKLKEVIFLPEHTPRGKQQVADIDSRVALIERSIAGIKNLRVARLKSKQFTVCDTLPELQNMFVGCEFTLLIGSDIARTLLYRWDGLARLLKETALAIGIRRGETPASMRQIVRQLESAYRTPIKYAVVHARHSGLSSSRLRQSKPAKTELVEEDVIHPKNPGAALG